MNTTVHQRLITELVRLTRVQNLHKGKALHAKIILTNYFSDVHLATGLVKLYAKCGHVAQAKLVFDKITDKNDASWSTIITTYAQQRTLESYAVVINLFNQMRAENSVPNTFSLAAVFTAVSNLGDIWGGKHVHGLAIKTGHFRDVVVGNTVLNMYCKSGLVADARCVFGEMSERSPVSWSTMLSGYASCCMAEEAVGIFKMAVTQGGEDEKREYGFFVTGVLSSFAVAELLDAGRGIHCFAVKVGVALIPEVRNAVLTMYVKCGGLSDALQVFSTSADKNAVMWSAIITGLAQKGNTKKALELFSEMHFCGIKPSEYTLVGVINACSSDVSDVRQGKQVHCYLIKTGFEMQIYIISSLVDMYAKCGDVADARKCFNSLREANVISWTSMISGYVQNGNNEEGLRLYARMQVEGIQPNELTLATVLNGCSRLAALEQGTQIHVDAIKYGLIKEITVGSSLSSMYAKCGCIDEAIIVFWKMTTRDLFSWNVMISGLVQNDLSNRALELFEDMRSKGVKPDNFTFIKILTACSHMRLVERSCEYFKLFSEEYGLVPKFEHYACMVDAFSRAGRLYEVKQFIESVDTNHAMCLWRILLGACHNYQHYELGAYAGEKLITLGSLDSAVYVMLSSIYIALGKLDDSKRIVGLMRDRRVAKEPVCSWTKSSRHVRKR